MAKCRNGKLRRAETSRFTTQISDDDQLLEKKAKQLKSASLFWRVTLYCRPFVKPMARKDIAGDAKGVTCLFDKDYFGRKMGDEKHNHVRREIAT